MFENARVCSKSYTVIHYCLLKVINLKGEERFEKKHVCHNTLCGRDMVDETGCETVSHLFV